MSPHTHLAALRPADRSGAPDDHGAQAPDGVLGARVAYAWDAPIRLTGPVADTLADHHRRHGVRPRTTGAQAGELLDTLSAIGLAGRGGGHFAAARKWRAVLDAGGGGTVVANAAEGEPASAKDAALLQHRPHLVLDGLAAAAETVGADRCVLWLHGGAATTRRAIVRALNERRAAGLPEPAVELVAAPDAYLSGESGAIVRALSGGPALPAFRRVPAAVSGVDGRPTLVHNVETLARVALAARTGAAGYRDTTLVTVVADERRTVLEVAPSATVGATVARVSDLAPQAVLLGGYGGAWLPWDRAAGLPLEHVALRRAGAGLGAGIVAPLPADRCGLRQTALVVDYLSRSGARQCGPCLFGLPDVAGLMHALAAGEAGRASVRRLLRFAGEIEGRGGCHHPDGVVNLVRSALDAFADDVHEHVRRGRCLHPGGPSVLPVPAEVPA